MCQNKKVKKSFKDCNNVCFGKAKLNICGICTGGNTTRLSTSGQDVCGVCSGDGTSCQGCDDVVNSGKLVDSCGKCLSKIDRDFDNTCFTINSFFPSSVPASGGDEIVVSGAGFSEDETVCFFEGTGYRYELKQVRSMYILYIFIFVSQIICTFDLIL